MIVYRFQQMITEIIYLFIKYLLIQLQQGGVDQVEGTIGKMLEKLKAEELVKKEKTDLYLVAW